MRRGFHLIGALAVLFLVQGTVRAQEDAKQLLEKAIMAHGGEEKLSKHKASRAKATGKIELLGGIDFTQEVSAMLPDKMKDRVELEVMGQRIVQESILNGEKFVLKINGNEIPLPDNLKSELKEMGHWTKIMRLLPLRGKEYELSLTGEVQVQGKPALGMRVAVKDHRDVTIFFDKATHRLVKIERRGVDPMSGNEFMEERIIAEYQTVDGVPTAKKIIVNRDGKKFLEAEVTEVKFFESLDDSEFNVQ